MPLLFEVPANSHWRLAGSAQANSYQLLAMS
jgi:hypothetical protein